jgi:hypothetical protein
MEVAIQTLSFGVTVEIGMDISEYGSTSSKEQKSSVMSSPVNKDWNTRGFFSLEELLRILPILPSLKFRLANLVTTPFSYFRF